MPLFKKFFNRKNKHVNVGEYPTYLSGFIHREVTRNQWIS